MVGPALASSFRQQASENKTGGGYGGYGSYSNGNDEYSSNTSNRGAYGAAGGGQGQGRRPSEDGASQQRYFNNDPMSNGIQPSSSSSSSNGPSSYSTRQNNYQHQQHQQLQNRQHQHQSQHDDNSYSNGGGIPSPTSMNGIPSSSMSSMQAGGSSVPASVSTKQPPVGSPEEIENSRRIARIHFEEFKAYLDAEGQRDPNARANAREKLTRLTRPQFQELSTDVYDELMRRQRAEGNALSGSAPEFLPQKSDFHPKRNQARQKLSTLPKTRFRDLASDVYFELERRYPEFNEDESSYPSSVPRSSEDTINNNGGNGRLGNGYPSNQVQLPSRSASRDDGLGNMNGNGPRLQSSTSNKRPQFPQGKPPMDYQSSSSSIPTTNTLASNTNGASAAPSTAANEVIIPNKSKVIEEDISLPASTVAGPSSSSQGSSSGIAQQQQQRGYGSYANQNGYMSGRKSSERERPNINSGNNSQDSLNERDNSVSPNLNNSGNSGNDGLIPRKSNETPRLGVNGSSGNTGPLLPTSPDWSNSLARASEASSLGTRLIGGYGSTPSDAGGGTRDWESDELEKVKSDYEYKIATMQNRMAGLEKDLLDSQSLKVQIEKESDERLNELENELEKMKMRNEDAQNNIELLERDLAQAQEQIRSLPSTSSYETSAASKDEEHKVELSNLEREVDTFRNKYNNERDATENLKNEIEGLVDTLKEMNMRQDDLANERESDMEKIRSLEEEVKEWKSRYEHAKTELRELKATSQLFVRPTKADDDYMPTSPGGAIMDSHVTRFQSSIDDLLISGRSDAPSSVIIATKQVINAVSRIDEDVQEYESAGMAEHLSPDDRERLYALKSKCNATLSNLTTAARNHATGHGLSPVSLLDAAASHLSNTIIELVRLLLMRKAGTPLIGNDIHSSSMKPSMSSTSISSRLDNASQSSSSNIAQQQQQQSQQSRNFPTRLASLKREDEAPGYGGGVGASQNAPGSSGRSSLASFRSRTVTASDRTHATSPEPQMRNGSSINGGDTSTSNSSFGGERNMKMNASTSETSLASNFHPDPRRNAIQQQQQQNYQQQQYQERDEQSSRQGQHQQHHHANDSQGSMRSHASNQSYQHEQDERRESGSDRQKQSEYRDDDVTEKQDVNGNDEDWADLKNYLESQTEAIVHSITALLAAIRGGAQPIKLQENLSQIITIVSSIVQILQDNLPSNLYEESKPTISELSSNCDKLIELQNSAEGSAGPGGAQTFSKQTKQAMATASFGVAKSLKSINSLLASV